MEKKTFSWLVALLALLATGCASTYKKELIDPPASGHKEALRMAFGSCNYHTNSQQYWQEINQHFGGVTGRGYPDAWIWAGDIVYADTDQSSAMREAYDGVKNGAYSSFRQGCEKSGCRVVGIWDDHDFGGNNLLGSGPDSARFTQLSKPERKAILLDFLGQPTTSKVSQQEQIYAAYDFDRGGVRARLVLLDLRYDRQAPGDQSEIMAREQWNWLEKNLMDKSVNLHLIVSSTQVLREDTKKDTWAAYPQQRERLLKMIGASPAQGVVLLTGDIHAAEISGMTGEEARKYGIRYDLYEITASGLNHLRCFFGVCDYGWKNAYRQGFEAQHNFGELDIARTADGAIALEATLRSSEMPAKVLLRKNIQFANR